MKKIISLIILIFLISTSLPAQKVNFYLSNARLEGSLFLVDVYANVQTGQTWTVGPTCIRLNYATIPTGGITLVSEDPVLNANVNLSNNSNYYDMTSSSICGDTAASLNIQQLLTGTPYSFNPGAYWLGTLKFNYVIPGCCVNMSFMHNSAVFSGLWSPMVYSTDWTATNPDSCMISAVSQHQVQEVPTKYYLSQNYPNPFNPTTSIKYSVIKPGLVSLKVYDILGRQVAELVNQYKSAGTYVVDFDASALTSGMYFYKLEAGDYKEVKRMILVK